MNYDANKLIELIDKKIKDIDIVGKKLVDTNKDLFKVENNLLIIENTIRQNTNFKELGLTNKESRELYIKNHDDMRVTLKHKQDLENSINEYKHILDVLNKELKLYNRVFDRTVKLECKCGGK